MAEMQNQSQLVPRAHIKSAQPLRIGSIAARHIVVSMLADSNLKMALACPEREEARERGSRLMGFVEFNPTPRIPLASAVYPTVHSENNPRMHTAQQRSKGLWDTHMKCRMLSAHQAAIMCTQ